MTMPTLPLSTLRALSIALLLALAACGGGVETGGTGAGSYVQGPISGFGSVIVAGVRFDDSTASIEDPDNAVRSRDDLRLGMLVEVESGPISADGSGGRMATATRVRLASELLGPLTTALDTSGTRIAVLGQPVRLTATTVVDGVAGGAAALAVGDVVEVFGYFAQFDGYVATRVERRRSAPDSYRVRGLVRDLDRMAHTMRIGMQGFDLTATGMPAALAEDQFVRLALRTVQTGGRWSVQSLSIETRSAGDHDEAEVEGLISAFTDAARFSVNGVRVDASNATRAGALALGVRVKVRGRSQAGVLVAASVDVRSDDDAFGDGVDVRDVIGTVDTRAQTFTLPLRGITVFYGGVAPDRFEHGTASDLVGGRLVRVRGLLSADRTRVLATRIEFLSN